MADAAHLGKCTSLLTEVTEAKPIHVQGGFIKYDSTTKYLVYAYRSGDWQGKRIL